MKLIVKKVVGVIATAGAVDGVPSVLDSHEKPPGFLCLFRMGKKEIPLKVANTYLSPSICARI